MPANTYHRVHDEVPAPPAGCPVRAWNPLSADYLADPYAAAGELREQTPIFYTDELGYVVVSRMEDIVAVFTDPDVYASVNVQDPVFPLSRRGGRSARLARLRPGRRHVQPARARPRAHPRAHADGFSNRRLKALEPYIARRSQRADRPHARRWSRRSSSSPRSRFRCRARLCSGSSGSPSSDDDC